jgi:outer membrane protein assembly factor BamD (BamD/ComL family)
MQVKTTAANRSSASTCILVAISFATFQVVLAARADDETDASAGALSFAAFHEALDASDDKTASILGQAIFERLERKYRNDAGFGALSHKLKAAEFLVEQMVAQLNKAQAQKITLVADELFKKGAYSRQAKLSAITPARSFYEQSAGLFSRPIATAELAGEEKAFLAAYYDYKLGLLATAVAMAGQGLILADPTFERMYDYTLVLPLLHVSGSEPVNVGILPCWMQKQAYMSTFSDSCLLQFGLPVQAMLFAKQRAKAQNQPFSEVNFYRSAARGCQDSHPHIAVDCLEKALACVPEADMDTRFALQYETVQVSLDSGNYALAAGQARKIFKTYPEHTKAGKAIWLHFYALSKGNDIGGILAHIDNALSDDHCEAYRPKLMYLKWWALRHKHDDTGALAALEYELLKDYGNSPMVAPILLSRATDRLVRQDYAGARESVIELVEKFPDTKAAAQANRMLEKLKTAGDVR